MDAVGILIFVNKDIFESRLIHLKHIAVFFEDRQHVEQQIAEIAGVERLEPLLILRIEQPALAIREPLTLACVNIGGDQPLILPLIDQPAKRARGEAFFIDIRRDDQLFHHAELIIGI